MKKRISMIMVICLLLSLTACGVNSGTNSNTEPSATQSQAETPPSEPAAEPTEEAAKMLVVYFSATGNTNVAHRKTRSDSTTVYPLTGLIRCPDCGKNIFGYTAPPRKKKNGKEGYYPRYISYRCISGRDRNGISCSLANRYYSGTKLETEVKEVISSMVTIPEFVERISQKIDIQTDVNSLRKKRTAIRNEITKYNGNLLQTEKRLTELDIADRHYQNKVDSLNRILDDLYEKIEDAQTRLDEVNQEITMVEKSAMTKKSIFEMLEGFSKYYDVMSPEDKKALLQAMVSFIELYPEKRDDKHLIKTIHFTFPVTYDGESGALFVRTNEQQVETVVLLSESEVDSKKIRVELFPCEEQRMQKRFAKVVAYRFPAQQKVLTQFDECGASVGTAALLARESEWEVRL